MGDYDSRNPHGTQSFDPFFSSQENPGVKARPSAAYPRRARPGEEFADDVPTPEHPSARDPYSVGSLSRKFDAYTGSVTPSGNLPPNEDFNSYLDAPPPLDNQYHPSGGLPLAEGNYHDDAPSYSRENFARPYASEEPLRSGEYAQENYAPEYQRTTGNLGTYGLDGQGVPYAQPPMDDMYADPPPTEYYPEDYAQQSYDAAQEPVGDYSARSQNSGWDGPSHRKSSAFRDDEPSFRGGAASERLLDDDIRPRQGGRGAMFEDDLPSQKIGREPLFGGEPPQRGGGGGGGGGLFGEDEPASRSRAVRLDDSDSWKMPDAKDETKKGDKGKKGKGKGKGKNGKGDPPPYLLPLLIGLGALLVIVIVVVVIITFNKPKNDSPSSLPAGSSESIPEYNLEEFAGTLLPQTEDAGTDYITDTLFIGDSNTLRMSEYSKATSVTLQNSIGVTGMGIDAASTTSCVYFVEYGTPMTIPAAVKLMQPQRIVLMYGTNDLVGKSPEDFAASYKRLIAKIQEAYPAATIIVASILPVTKANTYQSTVSMQGVIDYNKALAEMAQSMEMKMLNWTEALIGKNGYCDSKYMIEDGIHASEDGFKEMFKYFRTHSYITEDTRKMPLAKIPTRKPAPAPPSTSSEAEETPSSSKAKTISVTISSVIDGTPNLGGGTISVAGVGSGPSVSFTYTQGTAFPAFSVALASGYSLRTWICSDGAYVSGGAAGGTIDVSKFTGTSLVVQAKVFVPATTAPPVPDPTSPPVVSSEEPSSSSSSESVSDRLSQGMYSSNTDVVVVLTPWQREQWRMPTKW